MSLAALLLVAGCGTVRHQPAPAEVARAFVLPIAETDSVVEIRAACGTVVIAHGATPTCEVEAHMLAPSREAAEVLAAQVAPVPDEQDDGVSVVQLQMPAATDLATRVVIALHAPPTIAVRVLTRSAAVAVHGFQGALTIDSDSGTVTARLAGGRIDAHTVTGSIRVSGTFAAAVLRSVSGPVQVQVPHAEPPPTLQIETNSSDIHLELLSEAALDLDARMRTPRPLQCDLPVEWLVNAGDDGQRWRRYRGRIGSRAEGLRAAPVSVVSESGRLALRCMPGS